MPDAPLEGATPDLRAWFAAPTVDDWRAEASRLLRGRPLISLTRTLPGGLPCEPLFTAADVDVSRLGAPDAPPFRRGAGGLSRRETGWAVCGVHDAGTLDDAVRGLAAEIEAGATAAWLVPDLRGRGLSGDGQGLPLHTADHLAAALAQVPLERFAVHLDAGLTAGAWVRALRELADARGLPPEALTGAVLADPLGALVAGHALPEGLDAALDDLADVLRGAADVPRLRLVGVSTLAWGEAGADPVRELAWMLAAGAELLRGLDARGVPPEALACRVVLRLPVGSDTFLELAKLRAARWLWGRLIQACGAPVEAQEAQLHAVTSRSLLTARDPWTNLLRHTHGAFVAAVAGADVVTFVPWDRALGVPDPHARRVAATSQAVLRDEAHLAAVADPAGGSWYVEALTERLARAAWDGFRQLEREGGFAAAVRDGRLHRELIACRLEAERAVATRARPLVGTSVFPNPSEDRPARAPAHPPAAFREAAPWEALRDAADRAPRRPAAFLATLGAPARHQARADFARGLLEAGGLDVHGFPGSLEVPALVDGFLASHADGAVICGHDDDWADRVGPLIEALRAAGARFVVLAGRPGEHEAAWRARGLTHAVALGDDVLAVVRDLHHRLGVDR